MARDLPDFSVLGAGWVDESVRHVCWRARACGGCMVWLRVCADVRLGALRTFGFLVGDRMTALLYESSRALVFHGRWQEVLPIVGSVDVTITDPPYSEHVQENIRSVDTRGSVRVRKWDCDFASLSDFEHVPAFLVATARWTLCFCALEQFGDYLRAAGGQCSAKAPGAQYVRSWVWRKMQAAPQLSGDRPANSCEGIAVMHRPGKKRWNGHGQHAWTDLEREEFADVGVDNSCQFGRIRGREKLHPTEKPPPLCDHLVAKFSEPGEVVGDWYCGSGQIACAAIRAGRCAVACDSDLRWAEHSARAVEDAERGLAG